MTEQTPEQVYQQLGSLIAEMPDLAMGPITLEMNKWLGRVAPLVEAASGRESLIPLRLAAEGLNGSTREFNAQKIPVIVCEALARAEIKAPASARGVFVAAGDTLDALKAVARAMSEAKTDVLMVDPYADHSITDFAILAPENVPVRLLAKTGQDKFLKPVVRRWPQQMETLRPFTVRLAPAKDLHDRLVLVDNKTVWMIGQSFNRLAARSPTALVKLPTEIAAEKIVAYEDMWSLATPVS